AKSKAASRRRSARHPTCAIIPAAGPGAEVNSDVGCARARRIVFWPRMGALIQATACPGTTGEGERNPMGVALTAIPDISMVRPGNDLAGLLIRARDDAAMVLAEGGGAETGDHSCATRLHRAYSGRQCEMSSCRYRRRSRQLRY